MTVQVHTQFVCNQPGSWFSQLVQVEACHHALILIFPCESDESKWDTCIVYHPSQHQNSALKILTDTLQHDRGTYSHECIKGNTVEECEFCFHIILYAFLGHHIRNRNYFRNALSLLLTEDNVTSKVRRWISHLLTSEHQNQQFDHTPLWLRQLIHTANNPTVHYDNLGVNMELTSAI